MLNSRHCPDLSYTSNSSLISPLRVGDLIKQNEDRYWNLTDTRVPTLLQFISVVNSFVWNLTVGWRRIPFTSVVCWLTFTTLNRCSQERVCGYRERPLTRHFPSLALSMAMRATFSRGTLGPSFWPVEHAALIKIAPTLPIIIRYSKKIRTMYTLLICSRPSILLITHKTK